MVGITRRLKRINPKPRKFSLVGRAPRTVQTSPKQSGMLKSVSRDRGRTALLPGKRISRTGKEYWETRINRSDLRRNV